MQLTTDQIALYTKASPLDALRFTTHLNEAMSAYQIDNPQRVAAFLATVSIESARLSTTEESLYYKDAARLANIYPRVFKKPADALPYVRNPHALSMLLYSGFHGRGLIQLTWRKNYEAASEELGQDYVGLPDLVAQPYHAALTAAWYWATNGCNEAADEGDMDEVTRIVNGPRKMHLAERTALYESNIEALT